MLIAHVLQTTTASVYNWHIRTPEGVYFASCGVTQLEGVMRERFFVC